MNLYVLCEKVEQGTSGTTFLIRLNSKEINKYTAREAHETRVLELIGVVVPLWQQNNRETA